jgi:hypothetical protein
MALSSAPAATSEERSLPARQDKCTFRFLRTIIKSNGTDDASKDHYLLEEEFLKSSISKLQEQQQAEKGSGSPLIIFLIHGYGSTGSDMREKLFFWEGKIKLELKFLVLVVPINWDSALSTDSQDWMSSNWISRMLKENMLKSVKRSVDLGQWLVKCVTDAKYKGRVGIISHSMGTHAANIMTEKLKCDFSLLLNPHLYVKSYKNKDQSQKVIVVNIGDQVLRGSRSKFLDRSLGDATADPWKFWDNSLTLMRDNRTHLWFIDPMEAQIYDTDLKHGAYKHPFTALIVVDLVRGGKLPNVMCSRVPFTVTHKPIPIPSEFTSEASLIIGKRAPFELAALDEYHTALNSRYQAECTGCAVRSWKDDSNNTIHEKKIISREDVQELDGIDWDNMDVHVGTL